MKQVILFPSLPTGEEHTCKQQNIESLSQDVSLSLSHFRGREERERDPGNKRDQRSRQVCFLSSPDSSIVDSYFAAHTWDSTVSLLSGYLFPEDENQCRDFWEGLEVSWSSWIEGVIIQHLFAEMKIQICCVRQEKMTKTRKISM